VPFTLVRASRGKVTRAEPITALYEQGRVHHIGAFSQLEDQMCAFTVEFDALSVDDREVDSVVVDEGEPDELANTRKTDPECASLGGIDVELTNEAARPGEFHDFARLGRIVVDRVAIGGQQVSVWRKHQCERSAQVIVLEYGRTSAGRSASGAGLRYRKDILGSDALVASGF
jgi:hypothetical protein